MPMLERGGTPQKEGVGPSELWLMAGSSNRAGQTEQVSAWGGRAMVQGVREQNCSHCLLVPLPTGLQGVPSLVLSKHCCCQ